MARLIVTPAEPGGPERTIELAAETVSIGRDPSNSLPLAGEAKASRRHCTVVPMHGGYEVVDLESTNGTRVNGTDVKRRTLRPGDVIEVGLTKIRYEDEKAAAKADAQACFLEYTTGDRKGDVVTLDRPRTTFGRRETSTVVLADRMASGHHCEIVRDLNGYTLRDLGSTNGTLVNGAPVTEASLTHGARVRIGNTKFVFKDPAMAHIEVELAAMEEDDAGWGMMGELDLSKAGGAGGGVLTSVALLVVVGGIAVFAATRPPSTPTGAGPEDTNLVADGSFALKEPLWTPEEGTPTEDVARASSGRGALVVRHDGTSPGLAVARYSEEFTPKEREAYRVSAKISKDGTGIADLAVRWLRRENKETGAAALSETIRIGAAPASGTATVTRTIQRPRWAERGGAQLLVRAGSGTTAIVDDVVFEREASDAMPLPRFTAPPNDVEVSAARTGCVDVTKGVRVLLLAGCPWARVAGGRTLGGPDGWRPAGTPTAAGDGAIEVHGALADDQGEVSATVRWSPTSDGVAVSVLADGVEAVGLSTDLPRAHLEGGIGVIGEFRSRKLAAQDVPPLDGVSKVIAGDPHRLKVGNLTLPESVVLVTLPTGKGRIESRPTEDAGLFRMLLWQPGANAEFRLTTAFQGLFQEARARLSAARGLLETQPGPAIDDLYRIAEEFSFVDEVRDEARRLATAREAQAATDLKGLEEAIAKMEVYGSDESVDEASRLASDLARQFPKGAVASGPIPQSVWSAVDKVAATRTAIAVRRSLPEVRRLHRLASTLEGEKGYEAVAAVYWGVLVGEFGPLQGATGSPDAEEVTRKVEEARERLKALMARPEVAASVPAIPAVGMSGR